MKGASCVGAVKRAGELGQTVALEGHVAHLAVRDGVAVGIQHVDGDIHRLLVSGQEEIADRIGCAPCRCTDGYGVGKASIAGSQSCGWVESLAAGRHRHTDAGGIGRLAVGGEHLELDNDAAQRGAEVDVAGGGDVHRLSCGKCLKRVCSRKGCRRGAGQHNKDCRLESCKPPPPSCSCP